MGKREAVIDERIELSIDAVERSPERKWQDGVVGGEHGDGGSEDAGLKTREEAGDFPAIGG